MASAISNTLAIYAAIATNVELKKFLFGSAATSLTMFGLWKMSPSNFRTSTTLTLRTLYWGLFRSRGLRNIFLTAILLSIVSRHMFKGLTRKMSFPISFAIVWYLYYRTFVVAPSKLRCQRMIRVQQLRPNIEAFLR